jgi:hypothetical protein
MQNLNQNYYNGSFEVFDVSISLGASPFYGSCDIKSGRGQILTASSAGWANTGTPEALLTDAMQFGAPNSEGPDGFLLVTDKTITSMNSNVIGMRASPDGNYQGTLSMNTNFDMSINGGLPGSVNLSSWDWNEYTKSFIVVRSGSPW